MARGFESKSVTDQQEAAQAPRRGRDEAPDPATLAKRKQLELSRADVLRRLEVAHVDAHRQMLERALRALDEQIASLP